MRWERIHLAKERINRLRVSLLLRVSKIATYRIDFDINIIYANTQIVIISTDR